MLESSNHMRRSQRPSPRQSTPPLQAAPRQQETGQRRVVPRSGLQRLLAGLLSGGADGSSRRNLSRRDRLRQRRELSGHSVGVHSAGKSVRQVESSHRTQAPTRIAGNRERVIPIETRRESASGKQHSTNEPSPRIQRSEGRSHQNGSSPRDSGETPQKASPKQRGNPSHKVLQAKPRRSFSMSAFTQGMRLVILGVGVWAIVGTAFSVWDPSTRTGQVSQAAADSVSQEVAQETSTVHTMNVMAGLHLGQEMSGLSNKIAPFTQAMSDLVPGVFVMDLDSGEYFSINGESAFPAASMIKVPVLVAFFQDVDAGKIRLDEVLTLQQPDLASGSGEMQYAGVGTQYSALETATNMIINSDNTATNMIIRRLGGIEGLNQRFREWGLQQTVLHNLLPDLEGTNLLSPKELSTLIAQVSEGKLVSMKSRDRLFGIMERTVNNSLLPSSLGAGASIAHKTGDIGSLAGDAGLVDMPNGKRYTISVMVKRPHNDARAYELVVQIGGAVYEYLNQAASSPAMTGNPASYPPVSPAPESGAGR